MNNKIINFLNGKIPYTHIEIETELFSIAEMKQPWINNCVKITIEETRVKKLLLLPETADFDNTLQEIGGLLEERKPEICLLNICGYSEKCATLVKQFILDKCSKDTLIFLYLMRFDEKEIKLWLSKCPLSSNIKFIKVNCSQIKPSEVFDMCQEILHPFVLQIDEITHKKDTIKCLDYFCQNRTSVEALVFNYCEGIRETSHVIRNLNSNFLDNGHLIKGIFVVKDGSRIRSVFTDQELSKKRLHLKIEEFIREEAHAPYNRSKLTVVGEGQAGKTSTIKSLMNEKFNSNELSTVGVKITTVNTSDWKKSRDEPLIEHVNNISSYRDNETSIFQNFISLNEVENFQNNTWERINYYSTKVSEIFTSSCKAAIEIFKNRTGMFKQHDSLINSEEKHTSLEFCIWDFAGQKVFYTQHHLFLSDYSCYLVVFNVRKLLSETSRKKTIGYLKFWLNSIKLHAPLSPIVLTATHSSNIDAYGLQLANDILYEEIFSSSKYKITPREQKYFFPIDNKKKYGIKELKLALERTVIESDYISTLIPISFLKLLEMLNSTEEPYMRIEKAMLFLDECGLSEKKFKTCLRFLNNRGMLCYFDQPESLSNIVVLQPQWLIDGITTVLFDPELHQSPQYSSKMFDDFMQFQKTRILSQELLKDMWNKRKYMEDAQDFLTQLMLKGFLMCKYSTDFNEEQFLVPALFDFYTTSQIYKEENKFTGPFFVLDFSGHYLKGNSLKYIKHIVQFLPIGFCERLICMIINESSQYKRHALPILEDGTATVTFGSEIIIRISPLFSSSRILVSSIAGTTQKHIVDVINQIRFLVKTLKNEFFTKNRSVSHLEIELLVPSLPKFGEQFISYQRLLDELEQGTTEDEELFLTPAVSHDKLPLKAFKQWIEQ